MQKLATTVYLLLLSTGILLGQTIPKPSDVFGFQPGDDYKLADYEQIREYYKKLDAASDRIRVFEIGPTAEGRQMIMAVISSAANLAQMDHYRQISASLARGRVSPQEAEQAAAEGKAIVWIDGGLHATEVAHAQHSPLLAYRVVSDETPEMKSIRDNVILLQLPVMNPDGLDIVANWYRKNLGTPYETSPLPVLYQKYVGHDNNRDWYMMTQPETRAVAKQLYQSWYPQIVYNHHQSAPFPARIFIPPFAPPMNPNIPALVMRGINLVGSAMSTRFEEEGKAGVISRMGFTTWWDGGMRTAPYFHNMVGILTETALYRYATPHEYEKKALPTRFTDGTPTLDPSADYPNPWKGGWWRLRDAVDYMMTASLAVLDTGARYRRQWLLNSYQMAHWAIEEGTNGAPFAFLLPPGQHDPSSMVKLVNVLIRGGLEVHQAETPFQAEGKAYPAGTYILYASQAFRPYLLDLMEEQHYPERRLYPGGPPIRPYDITGWTLPIQMGVKSVRVSQNFQVQDHLVDQAVLPDPPALPSAATLLVDRSWNQSYALINDLLSTGTKVQVTLEEVEQDHRTFQPGSFVVSAQNRPLLQQLSERYKVPFYAFDAGNSGSLVDLTAPRVGIYRSWVANIDEGWTRWVLEQFGFHYRRLTNSEIQQGGLRNFDVLILPSQSISTLLNGRAAGRMPPEYSGGLGLDGFLEIQKFVKGGGILVALDRAGQLPVDDFGIPVQNSLRGVSSSDFYCPGSLLKIQVDTSDPVGFGMSPESAAFFENSQAFNIRNSKEDSAAVSVAKFADQDLLLSGWILGPGHLSGKSAVVRLKEGAGQIVLLGFRTHFRGQSHGTFKLLFNSILLGGMQAP